MLHPEILAAPDPMIIRGRLATLSSSAGGCTTPSYTRGATYDSVAFGGVGSSISVEHNSVLLVPELLSTEECGRLIQDVERCRVAELAAEASNGAAGAAADGLASWGKSTYGENWAGFQRYRIPRLSATTVDLVEEIFRERLLPFISQELPRVEDYLWARSVAACTEPGCNLAPPALRDSTIALGTLPYRFAPQEPAINRYTAGGAFPVHSDEQALTLNVLLETGCFEGGGTDFWQQQDTPTSNNVLATPSSVSSERAVAPSVTVEPTAAGVGVVFNGKVEHAGRPVISGVRHVLVPTSSGQICVPRGHSLQNYSTGIYLRSYYAHTIAW
jgi:hypothetical protein